MRINRIGNVFGSSFKPYTSPVSRVRGIDPVTRFPQEDPEEKKNPNGMKGKRDEYIPSDRDGRVIPKGNNYNDLGYLMRQAENSARFDNINMDE